MNEQEWLACTDPQPMLEFLRGKVSERKLWMFAVACWRQLCELYPDVSIQQAVDARELFADGLIGRDKLEATLQASGNLWLKNLDAYMHAVHLAFMTARWDERPSASTVSENQRSQCDFQRDIFGNPFRLMPEFDPTWRSQNDWAVFKIAIAIYDDRAFNHLPLLADALEDAGCDNAEILAHCRQPGPHVRGCWAVDLVLGKN